jgi:hypothetical protein
MAAQHSIHFLPNTHRETYKETVANDFVFFILKDVLWTRKYLSMLVKLIQKVSAQFIVQMEKMWRGQVPILSLLW